MQTALSLLPPSPSSSPLVLALFYLPRAMPVADTAIPLVKEFISWNGILFYVPLDKREVPCEQRVELEQPCAVHFQRFQG